MARYRLASLVTASLALAVTIGMGAAEARDSSLCALKEAPAVAATATAAAERCLEPRPEKAAAIQGDPVLQEDATGAAASAKGTITRAQNFVYRLLRPETTTPSGETIVLLHGSGGDEASLFKLASRIAPNATLLGVRGRIVQKGMKRWYAKVTPTEFDQADIRNEAEAFVAFLKERMQAEKLDLDHTVFIGYSNGANLIAAVSLLHPKLIERAVLLRAMPVLDQAPAADLKGTHFLTVAGKRDNVYAPYAPALEALLRDHGATVDSGSVAADHYLGDEDIKLVSDWLLRANAVAGGTPQ